MNLNCVICQDIFIPSADVVIIKCGHMFHSACLYQWIERSQSCPQCRKSATSKSIYKVYFNFATTVGETTDVATLQFQLDSGNFQLKLRDKTIQNYEENLTNLKGANKKLRKLVRELEVKETNMVSLVNTLKLQVKEFSSQTQQLELVKAEKNALCTKLNSLNQLQAILHEAAPEASQLLKEYKDTNGLAAMILSLKRELQQLNIKRDKLKRRYILIEHKLKNCEQKLTEKSSKITTLELENLQLAQEKKQSEKKVLELEESISTKGTCDKAASGGWVSKSDNPFTSECYNKEYDMSNMNVSIAESPSVRFDRVQQILNADSPYLRIKKSSVGVIPVLPIRGVANRIQHHRLALAKKSQVQVGEIELRNPLPDEAFQGLGGHPPVDEFSSMESNPVKRIKVSSISQKMRKLVKPASNGCKLIDDFFKD